MIIRETNVVTSVYGYAHEILVRVHRQAAKMETSLCKCIVSLEPLLADI